jgi:hypothetical protein
MSGSPDNNRVFFPRYLFLKISPDEGEDAPSGNAWQQPDGESVSPKNQKTRAYCCFLILEDKDRLIISRTK